MPHGPGRTRKSFRRSKKGDRIWTAALGEAALIGTTGIGTFIAQPVDWERSTVARETCTLLRIRGWLSVTPQVVDSNYNCAIIKIATARGTPDASAVATYTDFRILWTWNLLAATSLGSATRVQEIDVRQKVQISSNEDIRFIEIADTAASFATSFIFRGLLSV